MKKTLFLMTALLVAMPLEALAVPRRESRDMKLPTQQMVEKKTFTNPAAAGTTDVLSASAGNTSAAAATVSTFAAQPDVPRNLVVTPGTSTVDVGTCALVVNGTDINGSALAETFNFANDQSAAVTGNLAFRTVTSVAFPANCEDGSFAATWSIGYGEKLGLPHCMSSVGHILFSTLNGAKEGTAPSMTVWAGNSVAGVTADFDGTMNGSNDFELFYFQNFQCP